MQIISYKILRNTSTVQFVCPGNHISREELEEKIAVRTRDTPFTMNNKCFHGEYLSGLDLSYIDFSGCSFFGTNFSGNSTSLSGSNLSETDLRKANLYMVNLTKANLIGANLCESNLKEANLTDADLRRAHLFYVDFKDTVFNNTQGISKDSLGPRIKAEIDGFYDIAGEIYLKLRNNFNALADYDSDSWSYYRQRVCKMKSYSLFSLIQTFGNERKKLKLIGKLTMHWNILILWIKNGLMFLWLREVFLYSLWGFAQKPPRILIWSIITILVFAVAYSNFNLVCFGDLRCDNTISSLSWLDYLLFSMASFSTSSITNLIGSNKIANFLISLEGILGVTFLALFTTSLASRLGGK